MLQCQADCHVDGKAIQAHLLCSQKPVHQKLVPDWLQRANIKINTSGHLLSAKALEEQAAAVEDAGKLATFICSEKRSRYCTSTKSGLAVGLFHSENASQQPKCAGHFKNCFGYCIGIAGIIVRVCLPNFRRRIYLMLHVGEMLSAVQPLNSGGLQLAAGMPIANSIQATLFLETYIEAGFLR